MIRDVAPKIKSTLPTDNETIPRYSTGIELGTCDPSPFIYSFMEARFGITAARAVRVIPEISIRIPLIAVRIPIIVTPVGRFVVGVACMSVYAMSLL